MKAIGFSIGLRSNNINSLLEVIYFIHSVSQIFAAIMFVDDCGMKKPYQNSLSLWRRQNWKPVKILGREINSKVVDSPNQAKICAAHSTLLKTSITKDNTLTYTGFFLLFVSLIKLSKSCFSILANLGTSCPYTISPVQAGLHSAEYKVYLNKN